MMATRVVRGLSAVVAVALGASAAPAAAAERIAVLEFTGNATPAVLRTVTDRARAAALDPASRVGYSVMTRESTALVLQEMGGKCVDGQCEIEIARSVGAALVITGEVRKLGAACFADVKLHDTEKGTLLAVESFRTNDEIDAIERATGATERMLTAGLGRYFGKPVEVLKRGAEPAESPRWYIDVGASFKLLNSGPIFSERSSGRAVAPDVRVGRRLGEAWAVELGGAGTVDAATVSASSTGTTKVDAGWFLLAAVWAPIPRFRHVSIAAQAGVAVVGAQYTSPGGGYGESTTGPAAGLELRLDLPLASWLGLGLRAGAIYARPPTPSARTAPDGAQIVPDYDALMVVSANAGLRLRF